MSKNVIQIADHFVTIKEKRWLPEEKDCQHRDTTMDEDGQIVKCNDCGDNISPYWLLKNMLKSFDKARGEIKQEREAIREIQNTNIVLKAAKRAQEGWRSRNMVPCCPHCHRGILVTDGFGGSATNKEIELRRREVDADRKKTAQPTD